MLSVVCRRCLLPIVLCSLLVLATACTNAKLKPIVPKTRVTTDGEQSWALVLARVVTPDGYVRWDVLQKNEDGLTDTLRQYVGTLEVVSPDNRPDIFTADNDRWAYWVNAYNALSMYWVVLHNYPGHVPEDTSHKFLVGGKQISVKEIKQLLFAGYKNPRIVFALCDDAHGSPPLRSTPYDGPVLDAQLVDQAHVYLSDPRAVQRKDTTVLVNQMLMDDAMELTQTSPDDAAKNPGKLLAVLKEFALPDSPLHDATAIDKFDYDQSLDAPPR